MTLLDYFLENERLRSEWVFEKNTVEPVSLQTASRTKVWWRCEKGHEWQATPEARAVAGRNCPYCAGQLVQPGDNDLATRYPEKVALWDFELNGDLQPSDVTPGSHKKAWWRCEKGHSWQAVVYNVAISGCGCPYCSGMKAFPGETDLATVYPEAAACWDNSLNGSLTPQDVTAGSKVKAWWRCERGHSWQAAIYSIALEGSGCPYCAGTKAIPGETDLATLHPDLMEQWDFDKNTLEPGKITVASHDKAWWKCELGHSWKAVVFSRTRDQSAGCPYCTGRKVLPGFNDLATLKPKLADQWYQPLNGEQKPEDVTLGSNKKVWWQCSEGHVWQAFIYARAKKNGTGCPLCAGMVKRRPGSIVEAQQAATRNKATRRKRSENASASINA